MADSSSERAAQGSSGGRAPLGSSSERAVLEGVPTELYIAGRWRPATGGGTLPVEDPATGETLIEVADAQRPRCSRRARQRPPSTRPSGPRAAPRERGEILRRAYEALTARARSSPC